jgi:hypothetical protein
MSMQLAYVLYENRSKDKQIDVPLDISFDQDKMYDLRNELHDSFPDNDYYIQEVEFYHTEPMHNIDEIDIPF